jgi:hypothetical protein
MPTMKPSYPARITAWATLAIVLVPACMAQTEGLSGGILGPESTCMPSCTDPCTICAGTSPACMPLPDGSPGTCPPGQACSGGGCVASLAESNGSSCSSSTDCLSHDCYPNVCRGLGSGTSACMFNDDCESNTCGATNICG